MFALLLTFAVVSLTTIGFISYRYIVQNKLATINKILAIINTVSSTQSGSQEAQLVCGQVYGVKYMKDGRLHMIYFPINKELATLKKDKQIFLNIQDVTVALKQEAGVPYLITPEDFDPEATITVFDENTDETVTFKGKNSIL